MTHRVLHETKVGGTQVRPGALATPSERELLAAPWCFEALEKDSADVEAPKPDLFQKLMEQGRDRAAQDGANREATRRRLAQQFFQQGLAALGHGREQLQEHAEQLVGMALVAIESDRREREERAEYERKLAEEEAEGVARQAEADRLLKEAQTAFTAQVEPEVAQDPEPAQTEPPKPERRRRPMPAQE